MYTEYFMHCFEIRESPNKLNVSYAVQCMHKDTELELYFTWLADELRSMERQCERTIIYCQTIKQCSVIYATLNTSIRITSIRILVATIAFGMGINCKAVHRIIHYGPSKNVEAFVQET